jgi:effector-binding domain-containing protein
MLRYYDKCNLLCPQETDKFTGYRLYSAAQIPVLFRITTLRDMGFGVEEIAEILPVFNDAAQMRKILERKRSEIYASIAEEQLKLDKIAALSGSFEKESANMVYNAELKNLKAVKVLSLRENIPAYKAEGELWGKLGKFIAENKIECEQGGYSIYHDAEYKETDVDVEIAVPVAHSGKSEGNFIYKELEAIENAATIRFSGPYEGYGEAAEKLAKWVEDNGYVMDGILRGLAVASPSDVASEQDYLTELQVGVKKV